jgi:3',5'-cyclic AMP phosphodiesterase CpdA
MTKVVQIADVHFGAEDPRALAAAHELIVGLDPDAVVCCGDLTQRGRRSEFEAAADWIASFHHPMLVVPGNHDTPLLNLATRVARPFHRFDKRFGDLHRTVRLPAMNLSGFNTARGWQMRRNWAEGVVDMDELEEAIDAATVKTRPGVGVLACHHPFLSPPGSPLLIETRNGEIASRRMAESRVGLLLSGHVHTPSATVWRHGEAAYLSVTAGTLSQRLRQYPPSFNMLEIEADHVTVTSWAFGGEAFEPLVLGVWETAGWRRTDVLN